MQNPEEELKQYHQQIYKDVVVFELLNKHNFNY